MGNFELGTIIPAGKVFFPAGIPGFIDKESNTSALEHSGRGGVLLIGLGQTGSDILKTFFTRLPQYQNDDSPITKAISITAKSRSIPAGNDLAIEYFVLDAVHGAERIRATARQESTLRNIKKYLENEYRRNSPLAHIILVVNLSEGECGLIYPLLGLVAQLERLSPVPIPRTMFLVFNSPYSPMLDYQHQYSALREISHYLQTGIHIPDTDSADKLLARVYSFDGARNKLDHEVQEFLVTDALLTYINNHRSLQLSRNHEIRTIGIRSLSIPVLELRDYYAARLVREMWREGKTLLPSQELSHDDFVKRYKAFSNDRFYYGHLAEWLGEDIAGWLVRQDVAPPLFNEESTALEFIQKMVNYLSDLSQPDRFLIAGAGLRFVEDRVSSFPVLRAACHQLKQGIKSLWAYIPEYREHLDEVLEQKKQALGKTTTRETCRWNVINFNVRLEELFARILDAHQKERLFNQIKGRSGLLANFETSLTFFPIFVPMMMHGELILSDHVWHEYRDYFNRLFNAVSGYIMALLKESSEKVQPFDDSALRFMSEIDTPLADLAVPAMERGDYFIASSELSLDDVKRRVFKFNDPIFVPQGTAKHATALAIYFVSDMNDFKYIKRCAEAYIPNETTQIDEHLINAAYYEKQLMNSGSPRLFSEKLILTLDNRDNPIAFFKAFLAGTLRWEKRTSFWIIDSIVSRDWSYTKVDLAERKEGSLPPITKNIHSLWRAYQRFAIDIPHETGTNAWHEPLSTQQRMSYLSSLISYSRLDGSPEQAERKKWLKTQMEGVHDRLEIQDFYQLYQAVMTIISGETR